MSPIRHNCYNHPLYRIHQAMMARCYNPNRPDYKHYGGRGITVCQRWHSVQNFITDMHPKPAKNRSLDRIDNSRGYSPDNCRWATPEQQAGNTRKSKPFYARSPSGRWFKASVQMHFARKHRIDNSGIGKVLHRAIPTHRGWQFWFVK